VSRINWRSKHGHVEIMGWERHGIGGVVEDLACAFLPSVFAEEELRVRLNPAHHLASSDVPPGRLTQWAATSIKVGSNPALLADHDGTPLSNFPLLLNTALVVGSDPICLLARVHGQCELHCYVEGPNRAWMADLIDQGRAAGVYRAGAGWEELAELLRARDDEPVIADYSVTDSFPHCPKSWDAPIGEDGEPDWDAWYDLPEQERWALALADVRSEPVRGLELRPDGLRHPFGHGRTLLDLFMVAPRAKASSR
jgi:hypothetical protein